MHTPNFLLAVGIMWQSNVVNELVTSVTSFLPPHIMYMATLGGFAIAWYTTTQLLFYSHV